jgi:hypothetical protein
MNEKITLGGRSFRVVEQSTCAHDTWAMGIVRRAGLERLELLQGESPEEFAWRAFGNVIDAGALYELLGAFLIPVEVPDLKWTPGLAAETGKFFGDRSEPEEKERVRALVLSTVFPFLKDGLASFASSVSSSSEGRSQSPDLASSTASGEG